MNYVKVLYQKLWENICQGSKKQTKVPILANRQDDTRTECSGYSPALFCSGQAVPPGMGREMQVRKAVIVGVSQLPRSQVGPTHPYCIQGHLLWGLKFLLWEEAVPGLCEEGLVGFWVPQLSQPDWLKQQSEETNDSVYPGWLHPRWLTEVTPAEQGPVVWWV